MRPIKLAFQAFGPYVEKQVIDFRLFQASSLFLIQGETGSGKTMILDAITYALYGKSSGGQREDFDYMRSRFAQDKQCTYIAFTFSLKQHTYRFSRVVEVKKKRNNEKQYKISVDAGEIIDETYYPFFENPKRKEIEEKATDLIGLNHAQFIQVMILPQGKFEQLLTSKSDEKQEILKTLFQMGRWEKINAYLIEKLRLQRIAIEEKKQQVQAYLQGIQVHDAQAIMDWIAQANDDENRLQRDLERTRSKRKEKQKILQEQLTLQALLKEKDSALLQQQQLLDQAQHIANVKKIVQHQKKVAEVIHYKEALDHVQKHKQQRMVQLEEANALQLVLDEQMSKRTAMEMKLQHLEQEETVFASKYAMRKAQIPIYEDYQRLTDTVTKRTEKEQIVKQQYLKEKETLVQLQTSLMTLREQSRILRKELTDFKAQKQVFQCMQQAYIVYQKVQRTIQVEQRANAQQNLLLEKVEKQKQKLSSLQMLHDTRYRQFLDNATYQLAQFLKENIPCPVCGSQHHPNPYKIEKEYMDVTTLKQLQVEIDAHTKHLEKLLRNVQQEEVYRIQSQTQRAEYEMEITNLLQGPFKEEEYAALRQTISVKQAQEETFEQLQTIIEGQIESIQKQEMRTHQLEEEYQNYKVETLVLKTKAKACCTQLLEDIPSLEELHQSLKKMEEQHRATKQKVNTLRHQLQEQLVVFEKHKEEVNRKEVEFVFVKEEEAKAQRILQTECDQRHLRIEEIKDVSMHHLQEQEKEIQQYEIRCVQVETTLKNIEGKFMNATLKDITQLKKDVVDMESRIAQQEKEVAALQSNTTLYERVAKKIQKIQEELCVLEPAFLKQNDFVKALRGDNGMGIERYVLGVMLLSITKNANELLKHIHNGRYQIYRSDESSGRTRKFGLELRIYDAYTYSYRSVVSLSGGEKFLVSLALSLALSSVVQARNGGIHFDAMFIDEGFGTLDEHSIADALQVLERMRTQKGVVGIISHVDLLKMNIPAGIDVIKTRQGSKLLMRKG